MDSRAGYTRLDVHSVDLTLPTGRGSSLTYICFEFIISCVHAPHRAHAKSEVRKVGDGCVGISDNLWSINNFYQMREQIYNVLLASKLYRLNPTSVGHSHQLLQRLGFVKQ